MISPIIKNIFFESLDRFRLVDIFNKICGNRGLTILTYHTVIDSKFEEQILFLLKKGYKFISLDEALEKLESGKNLDKYIVLTFDDGHKSFLDILPIINKHKLPITIYCTVNSVGKFFWWEIFELYLKEHRLNISQKDLREMPNSEFNIILKKIKAKFTIRRTALDWKELSQLSRNELISIQSHTVTHPFLHRCNDDESYSEISHSKKIFEDRLGIKIKHFCYPNGDYDSRHTKILKECSYVSAVTTKKGTNISNSNFFELERIAINVNDNLSTFKSRLYGLF